MPLLKNLATLVAIAVGLFILLVVVIILVAKHRPTSQAPTSQAAQKPQASVPMATHKKRLQASPEVSEQKTTYPAIDQQVRELTLTGENLYQEASDIVDDTPTTETGAAEAVGSGGGSQFYDEDRAFQSAIGNLANGTPEHLLTGKDWLAQGDLSEAETFLYSSVEASLASCNQHDAELNLKVARAFLDEVHRDLNGTERSDWSPPDITGEEDNNSECQSQDQP